MKIHYVQAFDRNSPPNIGWAINQAIIELRPNVNDWIVNMDSDICFLRPDSKKQLEEVLLTTDRDILAPLTNRLASNTQLLTGLFDEFDMREHIKIANARHEMAYGKIHKVNDPLAAMCLCFKVGTWKEMGGFAENNIQFDYLFCSRALRAGKKLALFAGIYVYHNYRMWAEGDPRREIKHLL